MFHAFSLIASILAIYIGISLILPLKLKLYWKLPLFIPLLMAAQKNEVLHFFGGGMFFAPVLPSWLLIGLSIGFNTLVMLFFFTLLKDAILLIMMIINYFMKKKIQFSKYYGIASGVIVAISLFLGVWGTINALLIPEVRNETLEIADLPAGLENLRIAILADTHCSAVNRKEFIRGITERTNAQNPDLILLLGDLVDGTPEQRKADLSPLKDLKTKYGIFGIPGNHEYYSGYREWMKIYRKWGFVMLENSGEELQINGAPLYIAGVTNTAARRFNLPMPDTEKAMNNCPANAVAFLLEHEPKTARKNTKYPVTAQFSGHTHGGMVAGLDKHFIARFNGGFAAGWYDLGKSKLYVSRGTGLWNGFIFRFGVPSEITILTLKKK